MNIRPQTNGFRDAIDVSGIWRIAFDPGNIGEADGWTSGLKTQTHPIAVPGSWNEQLAELGYMNYIGDAWLQTDVFVPKAFDGRDIGLRFGSADYSAKVWVNGEFAGISGAQHLPFDLDISKFVAAGQTAKLVVKVTSLLPKQGPTQRVMQEDYALEGRPKDEYLPAVRFDFFPYGGLNRPVYLCALPKARFTSWKVQTNSEADTTTVSFCAHVSRNVQHISLRVTAPVSNEVLIAQAPIVDGLATLELVIDDAALWSPESPNLYSITFLAYDDTGETCDEVTGRFGIRNVTVSGNQLLLNGQPITLKGFGMHEDSAFRGRGLDLPRMVKDFHLLDWCGANSVRTSHYPYAEEFYDFCDERGIIVIDEVFCINLDFRKVAPEGLAAHKAAVAQLIARDQNHPCVIAWSLANEPGYLGESVYATASKPYWEELFAFAREQDPTRPLTHANVNYAGLDDPAFETSDFLMINRYYGWYQAPAQLDRAIEMLNADFDTLASTHNKPIFVAEFGADALSGQHATYPQLFTEDFQSDFIAAYWAAIMAHPSVIGGHVWNFADFRTAQHGRRVVFNLKGVFTRDRTPKKAAFTLRDLWGGPSRRVEL